MAWLECPETGREFRLMTRNGTRYGTNMPYVECCPFCGATMNDSHVTEFE